MKELIKKILREGQDKERIIKNEKEVPIILPHIVTFIKEKYGNSVKVKTKSKKVLFGSDMYRGTCKEIEVYVENESLLAADVKYQLRKDIKNFFGIDLSNYGVCLDLSVYKKIWEKV